MQNNGETNIQESEVERVRKHVARLRKKIELELRAARIQDAHRFVRNIAC
jgi:hypothetical protein